MGLLTGGQLQVALHVLDPLLDGRVPTLPERRALLGVPGLAGAPPGLGPVGVDHTGD